MNFDYEWHLVHVETNDVGGECKSVSWMDTSRDTDIDGADPSVLSCKDIYTA